MHISCVLIYWPTADSKTDRNYIKGLHMLRIAKDVKRAIYEKRAVVALETALVTHGLPAPLGVETALASEAAVREVGAVPATIGILRGEIIVGLSNAELSELAAMGDECIKAGVRDLAVLAATGGSGSTTVSAMLATAARVGITLASTGGIGGVHRDWQQSADRSSDLLALSRSPVALVSSGFKSILDVPATFEALETLGVPVIGYKTQVLPGFYTNGESESQRIPLEHRVDNSQQAAKIMQAQWSVLGRSEGLLFANPPPADKALDQRQVDAAVNSALEQARSQEISGKELTPFLLEKTVGVLGQEALQSNTALIVNNAATAAHIAIAFRSIIGGERIGF